MAVESKPLFHLEVIRQHLRSFILPESMAACDGTVACIGPWSNSGTCSYIANV